jgi:hypothetical protein
MFVTATPLAEISEAARLPMTKRIIAGILGTLGAFGSLVAVGYAFELSKDFGTPGVSFWPNVLGEILMCSMALAGMWVGLRFLRFATSGVSHESESWVRPLLLGIGSFFPGFVFSFPIIALWVVHTWPRDNGKLDLALEVSACIGVATSVICTIVLSRKRVPRHIP